MRDIKFRAWDKNTHSMINASDLTTAASRILKDSLVSNDRHTLMQYTGFRDCKGNEIYEGDIVYVAGFGKAKAIITHAHGSEFEDKTGHHRSMINAGIEKDIGEVIGNVHQNPDLLEQNT